VPTIRREDIRFKKWWAQRRCAFAHPTHFSVEIEDLLVDVDGHIIDERLDLHYLDERA
jgi:hypothetical protein